MPTRIAGRLRISELGFVHPLHMGGNCDDWLDILVLNLAPDG